MKMLRRWWSRGIANRIAGAAALVIAVLVAMLAALAYGNSRTLLLRNADERLEGYAELLANRMALMLSSVDADTRALAANSLVTNGLLDSSGREAYLGPFLRDQRLRGGTEHTLTLVDHRGAPLVSNAQGPAPDYTRAPWLARLMESSASVAAWADPARTTLLLAYPVRVPATQEPEGALVLEVSLVTKFVEAASVLPPEVRARLVDGTRGVAQSGGGGVDGDQPLVAMRHLHGAESVAALDLSAESALPRSAALAGLYEMTRQIVLAGLLALVAAALAARWVVGRLLAPLGAMSATARRIRAERRFDLAMPGRGGDEIGTVALGFNDVLALVREGQTRLEQEVRARTAALERTRAHLDAVQRQMSDGLVVVDESGRVESFNEAAERLFGQAAAQAVGHGVAGLIPLWPSLKAGAAVEIAEQGRFQRSVSARRGAASFAAEISVALMHHQGRTQWVVLVRDDTEQQQAHAAMAHHQRLLEESVRQLRRNDEDMARINRMNELLAACERHDEAHAVIENTLAQLFAGHAGALAVQRADGELAVVARWGERSLSQAQFAPADCWSLRLGRRHDGRTGTVPPCRHCADAKAGVVCLPLLVHGETLGVLTASCAAGADEEHRVQTLLDSVGEAIKFGLANLKLRDALREAALRDPLTGLFNRRYFDETAPREVQRTHRSGEPLVLAAMDLDHFKRFNDGFGHEAGDLVLCETARVLASGLRSTDILFRVGGEELVALLPASTAEDAAVRLEAVRRQLASLSLQHEGRLLPPVTMSIGIAPAHGGTPEALMRAADLALYAAKARGRNRIVLAPGVPPQVAVTQA
jgi:diguanylate cyclase (GGDEF)-like protein/PAS domain S-box-containing protein